MNTEIDISMRTLDPREGIFLGSHWVGETNVEFVILSNTSKAAAHCLLEKFPHKFSEIFGNPQKIPLEFSFL